MKEMSNNSESHDLYLAAADKLAELGNLNLEYFTGKWSAITASFDPLQIECVLAHAHRGWPLDDLELLDSIRVDFEVCLHEIKPERASVIDHYLKAKCVQLERTARANDSWYHEMPVEFRREDARKLFYAARKAGIIAYYDAGEHWVACTGISRQQLAYWCSEACRRLGMVRGGGDTYWKPFAEAFGVQPKSLASDMQRIFINKDRQEGIDHDQAMRIDNFFAQFEQNNII